MFNRASSRMLWRWAGIAAAAATLAAGCGDSGGPAPGGADTAAPATPAASGSAAAPKEKRAPRSLQGSAIALSVEGDRLFVADEDHEAVFVARAPLGDAADVRVVEPPGPPAQVVALDGLVLVTVRTVPTEDARAARAAIRGPALAGAKMYPASTLKEAPLNTFWNTKLTPDQLERWLAGELTLPDKRSGSGRPKATGAPPRASAPPAAASGAPPGPSADASASARPKRNTPAAPFDPSVVRKSQGGLLLAYRPDPDKGLVEAGRVVLPPDAWGLAVTPDGRRAVVTSAWSAQVSVVELEGMKVLATLPVAREPRGVAIAADGKSAFVSHVVGAALTKITGLDGAPAAAALPFPAAPARTPIGWELGASLAYAIVFSPDQRSLYVPRHALGAEGIEAWWGAPTVDILDTATEKPLAPKRAPGLPSTSMPTTEIMPPADWSASAGQAPSPRPELVQPRAVVYRKKTDTLLIASEGWDSLVEVDALTVDPAMFVVRTYDLAAAYDAFGSFPVRGGAPSAVALSPDEDTAYVFCKTTFDVAQIDLASSRASWLHLADDGLPADAAYGRRLFAGARSERISGGLGCAGCHPDGRDDGYVWREGEVAGVGEGARFIGLRANVKIKSPWRQEEDRPKPKLHARQTPLIAGRTRAPGPYGWHGENKTLVDRLFAGFALHRAGWDVAWDRGGQDLAKVDYLADFLRSGLLPPPTLSRALTEAEQKGKAIFDSKQTGCATCHTPEGGYTDRAVVSLRALPTPLGFDAEENRNFKTPSLWFIAGTAPYFHDGSAATLEDLIRTNGSRMGQTSHLSPEDQAALVAYLRTL